MSDKTMTNEELPVGARIRFLKTLTSGPDDYSPGNLYARKGDGGEVTGHGCKEGHWVKWDDWDAPFGAELGIEFEQEESMSNCEICPKLKPKNANPRTRTCSPECASVLRKRIREEKNWSCMAKANNDLMSLPSPFMFIQNQFIYGAR